MNIFVCLFIAYCIIGFFLLLFKICEWLEYSFDIDSETLFSISTLVIMLTIFLYLISNTK